MAGGPPRRAEAAMTLPSIARASVIVLLGDHRQFQAVAYGDALGKTQAIEPGVDMQTTMRKKTLRPLSNPEWVMPV